MGNFLIWDILSQESTQGLPPILDIVLEEILLPVRHGASDILIVLAEELPPVLGEVAIPHVDRQLVDHHLRGVLRLFAFRLVGLPAVPDRALYGLVPGVFIADGEDDFG